MQNNRKNLKRKITEKEVVDPSREEAIIIKKDQTFLVQEKMIDLVQILKKGVTKIEERIVQIGKTKRFLNLKKGLAKNLLKKVVLEKKGEDFQCKEKTLETSSRLLLLDFVHLNNQLLKLIYLQDTKILVFPSPLLCPQECQL